MAGRQRPSFLKRQKENQRRARADQKREARRARREAGPPEADEADVRELDVPTEASEDRESGVG